MGGLSTLVSDALVKYCGPSVYAAEKDFLTKGSIEKAGPSIRLSSKHDVGEDRIR